MNPAEFCQWLDGYLMDREHPDAEVIKAKAREIAPVAVDPLGPFRTPPYQPLPIIGEPLRTQPIQPWPWTAPSTGDPPPWKVGEIFCGQAAADPGRQPMDVRFPQ